MESKALNAALAAKDTATDGAYIMAQDANGNTVRIAKADLASVLAVQHRTESLRRIPLTANVRTKVGNVTYGGSGLLIASDLGYSFVCLYVNKAMTSTEIKYLSNQPMLTLEMEGLEIYITSTTDRPNFAFRIYRLS